MRWSRLTGLVLAAALIAGAVSCSSGTKVIPKDKMEAIYREMFLADQWVNTYGLKRPIADTTWFYAPIFEKYGYTVEDYRASVEYYLADPKRFAEMIGRVSESLQDEASVINVRIRDRSVERHKRDSISRVLNSYRLEDMRLPGDISKTGHPVGKVTFEKTDRGFYVPGSAPADTSYSGPEIILRDTSLASVTPPEKKEKKLLIWRD